MEFKLIETSTSLCIFNLAQLIKCLAQLSLVEANFLLACSYRQTARVQEKCKKVQQTSSQTSNPSARARARDSSCHHHHQYHHHHHHHHRRSIPPRAAAAASKPVGLHSSAAAGEAAKSAAERPRRQKRRRLVVVPRCFCASGPERRLLGTRRRALTARFKKKTRTNGEHEVRRRKARDEEEEARGAPCDRRQRNAHGVAGPHRPGSTFFFLLLPSPRERSEHNVRYCAHSELYVHEELRRGTTRSLFFSASTRAWLGSRGKKKECVKMTSIFPLCGIIVILLYGPIGSVYGERQELGMSFTRHPQPLAAPLNDDVNFECSLNLAAERFAWHHRPLNSNKWIPLSHSTNSSGKTSRHVVNFDNESKAGDYRCIAFFGTSGLASDPAKLTLATIQKFSDKNDVFIQVAEGNTVPITCPIPYSEPEAIVQFYKNDELLENANLVNSKIMVIKNVGLSNSGSYHCSANNYITQQIFTSNHKTILTVHANTTFQAPYFIKQPQTEYIVPRGKNITLECFAAGYPVPRIIWSRLGSSLPLKSVQSSTGLTIVHVQPSDRGEYDCVWSNEVRQIKSVIILRVVEPPKVTRQPKASTFSEGGELELSCSVTGEPEPSIEWLINGKSLVSNKNQEIRGSTLLISEVEKKHAGIVQCVASNKYGSHSGYNLLRVNPKQHVLGGTTESRPDYGTISRHKHTRGGGRRRNKEGKKKGAAVLVPPNQPNVTRLSDVSVMVRWSVPENNGLPIQFFKVQYRELSPKTNGKQTNNTKWMTANSEIPNHVRSFEVTDLQPNHTYRFRIAAVYSNNDNKLSTNSVRFHLNRDAGIESNKMPIPLLTNTEALGPHQVLLIWQNPDKSVKIDGFYIYHRASTTAGEYLKTTVEGKDAYNMTISHLQSETVYEFKIQSFSVDAASEFSHILRQKTGKSIEEHPVQQVIAENKLRPSESNKNVSIQVIIGGVFGGAVILAALVFVAGCLYKRAKYKQNQESQSEGKPITNGRVMNGGVTDSKINITSNPLAGLDASEDIMQPKSGQQSSMEMTSFLNGQNNNGSNNGHNNGDAAGSDVNVTSHSEPPSLRQGPLPIEQRL